MWECPSVLDHAPRPKGRQPAARGKPAPEDPREDGGVAVLRVASGVYERERPCARATPQPCHLFSLSAQFLDVEPSELLEALGLVAEPPAELVGRPKLARPFVYERVRFRNSARPEPVDQYPVAVAGCGVIVD